MIASAPTNSTAALSPPEGSLKTTFPILQGKRSHSPLTKCILPVTPPFSRGYHRDDDHLDLDVAYLYYERFDDNAPTREPADFSATTSKLLWMCPADLFSVRLP